MNDRKKLKMAKKSRKRKKNFAPGSTKERMKNS